MADGDDIVEHPVCKTLFRQSSVETHVTALAPPELSDAESDTEFKRSSKPRVVDIILKVTPASPEVKETSDDLYYEDPPEYEAPIDASTTPESTESPVSNPTHEEQEPREKDLTAIPAPPPELETYDNEIDQILESKELKEKTQVDFRHGADAGPESNEDAHVRFKESQDKSDRSSYVGTLRGFAPRKKRLSQGGGAGGGMASPRPKSPRPPVARKDEKEESFWEKIGTLGRKKRIKEVQEVQEEGKYAIDSPGSPTAPDLPPEDYTLEENEERSMIEPRSFDDPKFKELVAVLIEWINDELADQRIIVKDMEQDLYDGQVLQKLLEKLSGTKLDVPEVTQSEEGQKQKLGIVLAAANRVLGHPRWSHQKWSVESIHSKNLVAILHLLVALARHFRAPVRLPENVALEVVVVQKRDGSLSHRTVLEEITSTYDELGMRCERDAFDTLFDHAPDKLQVVKKSLVTFVNKHLNKVNLEVTDLDTQFHDGVYLTILMGLLEGFFVPLHSFHLTPQDFDNKVHNVAFAFELMQDVGIAKPKARPEDIVNLDLKSTLRVLYNLFTKYKNMS